MSSARLSCWRPRTIYTGEDRFDWSYRPKRAALLLQQERQREPSKFIGVVIVSMHQRGGNPPPRTFNRYPSAPDGRGATSVPPRKVPVGTDLFAVGEGKADTAASQEYLKAQRERLAKE